MSHMAKTEGYKVPITGTLPVAVSSKKELQKMAALIATAEGGDAAGVLKRLEDVSVQISDGSKPGRKAKGKRKAKAGGKKRGPKPKQGELPLEPSPPTSAEGDPPAENE